MPLTDTGEQKHTMAVTTAKPVAAFSVLTVTINLSRLTTATMNGHAAMSKPQK